MGHFNFHPKSVVKLGCSFDARNPSDDKSLNGIFEWQNFEKQNKNLGAQIEFEMTEIDTRKKFFEKMSLDISAEAKFSLSTGESSINWEKEIEFKENTLIYVFIGKITYTEESANGIIKLSQSGQDLLNFLQQTNKIINFFKVSGTDIVTKVVKGNIISLTYVFTLTSKESKEKLRNHLGVSWTSGNINVDFEDYKRKYDSSMRLYVKAFQANINELTPKDARITALIEKNPGNLIDVKQTFRTILDEINELNRSTAPILYFNTAPITSIPQIVMCDGVNSLEDYLNLNPIVDEECSNLRDTLIETNYRLSIIRKYHNEWNEQQFEKDSKKTIDDLINKYNEIKKEILISFKQIISLSQMKDFMRNEITIPRLDYDKILNSPYVKLKAWDFASSAICSHERISVTTKIFLRLKILFPEAINQIDIVIEDKVLSSLFDDDINSIISKEGSTLDFWNMTYNDNGIECWGCHDNEQLQKRLGYLESHKAKEKGKNYILKIYTVNAYSG
jgi:hypothetical protein